MAQQAQRHKRIRSNTRTQLRSCVKVMNDKHTHKHNDKRNEIHIPIKYDNYDATAYMPVVYRKTRDTHAQRYVGITNAVNDTFPEINAPHNAHTYRANAPYHKYIPVETHHIRPALSPDEMGDHYDYQPHTKCIIYDKNDNMIHYGTFGRERTINYITREAHTILHRANRTLEVYPYIPRTSSIHGVSVAEIKKKGVEIYHI